jgi:hypothetical protein
MVPSGIIQGVRAMKLKNKQKIIAYTHTDLTGYSSGEEYLHVKIMVGKATVVDALEWYLSTGDKYYLKKAESLRESTGNTIYIDSQAPCSGLDLRWQTHREGSRGDYYYPLPYGCRIDRCDFDSESIAIAAKLAKLATRSGDTSPMQVVEALKAVKAVCVAWHKGADCHIDACHLSDSLFGLPEDLRQGDRARV